MKSYVINAQNALDAWKIQDWNVLSTNANAVYNHFVHHPEDFLSIEYPLTVGSVFFVMLGYTTPDEDIQEVRAENMLLCLSKCLENPAEKRLAAMRLFLLFSMHFSHLQKKLDRVWSSHTQYDIFSRIMSSKQLQMNVLAYLSSLFTIDNAQLLEVPFEIKMLKEHYSSFCSHFGQINENDSAIGASVIKMLVADITDDLERYIQYKKQ